LLAVVQLCQEHNQPNLGMQAPSRHAERWRSLTAP
jgi:hypothetical protein